MDKRVKRGLRAARPKYQDGGSLPFVSIPPDDLAKAQADPQRYERFFEPIAAGVKSLGDLVKAPFDMARDARQAGGYSQLNPTDVGRAGLNTGLGTLMPAVGGVGGRGGAVLMSGAGPTDKGIKAYHGSPHDFDKFDMSKIGTGEGAQAYGHGLYFAQSEDVARSYRDNLSHPARPVIGVPTPTPIAHIDGKMFEPGNYAITTLTQKHRNPQELKVALQQYVDEGVDNPYAEVGDARKIIDAIDQGKYSDGSPGRMYEVRIDADPEDFLDWDKPLSQQSEKVREGVYKLPGVQEGDEFQRNFLGEDKGYSGAAAVAKAGKWNRSNIHPPEAMADVSRQLREAGIPGIKYLDAGSRTAGEGSRNYVVFSDEIVQIIRKYGMAAAVSMYGADAVNDALQPMTGNDG